MAAIRDLRGEQFGSFIVVDEYGTVKSGKGTRHAWICECECGSLVIRNHDAMVGNHRNKIRHHQEQNQPIPLARRKGFDNKR